MLQLLEMFAQFERDTKAARRFFERAIGTTKIVELPRFRGHVGYAAGAGGRCCCS